MYKIDFEDTDKVAKFLKNIPKTDAKRIIDKIEPLSENPYPGDAKFVKSKTYKNLKIFRIRCGKFRILYYVKHEKLMVVIVKIDKRDKVYQSK
jgi:mRNA interferase RelE/StbE